MDANVGSSRRRFRSERGFSCFGFLCSRRFAKKREKKDGAPSGTSPFFLSSGLGPFCDGLFAMRKWAQLRVELLRESGLYELDRSFWAWWIWAADWARYCFRRLYKLGRNRSTLSILFSFSCYFFIYLFIIIIIILQKTRV